MQKQPFQFDDGLILYEKPISLGNHKSGEINKGSIQGKADLKSILGILIPPKVFQKQIAGKKSKFVLYANQQKVSRNDADLLRQKMNKLLEIKKAKFQPICPIRQEIFAQAFAEIIRQVVIDCHERGIMLGRVRNEVYLSISSYCTLYQESIKFSKNELVESQNKLIDLENEEKQLLLKQNKLREKQRYLLSKKQTLQQKARQIRTIYQEKRQHEMKSLKEQHDGLQSFISQMKGIKNDEGKKQK